MASLHLNDIQWNSNKCNRLHKSTLGNLRMRVLAATGNLSHFVISSEPLSVEIARWLILKSSIAFTSFTKFHQKLYELIKIPRKSLRMMTTRNLLNVHSHNGAEARTSMKLELWVMKFSIGTSKWNQNFKYLNKLGDG